jgi:hypothetical protein
MRTKFSSVVGLAALLGTVCQATAVPLLPDAVYSGNLSYQLITPNIGGVSSGQPGPISAGTGSSPSYVQVQGAASPMPAPNISSSINAGIAADLPPAFAYCNCAGGSTSEEITYSMEILGPQGNVNVDVNALGSVTATVSATQGNYNLFGQAFFGIIGVLTDNATLSNSGVGGFTDTNHYVFATNRIYTVRLLTQANATVTSGSADETISVLASVDPMFTIDPLTIDPNLYSFDFSAGIGNSSVTPLPPTWLMLLGGLVGLGCFASFGAKKRAAAIAAA